MRTRLRRLAVTLALVAILLSSAMTSLSLVLGQSSVVEIDVFTQKQPYSGKGQNETSDAFGPEEVVFLYATVTCSGFALENMIVAFSVRAPNDEHFAISARTDTSGIATVNFTILTPPININEEDVFGNWLVLGSVLVGSQVFQDSLSFKVDWIVKLLSVRTINENFTYHETFGRGGDVGLEIKFRSVAMTLKNATIAVTVKDELNVPVSLFMVRDFSVQPNEKLLYLSCKASLPSYAAVGNAIVYVTALTKPVNESGVPYCPSVFAQFLITGLGPLKINYHDVAVVAVLPSINPVVLGQGLSLKTIVRNEGTVAENFSVSTYFNDVLLGTFEITSLSPYSVATFEVVVNASLLALGNHTISASIPQVANERDLTDNVYVDVVAVVPRPPIVVHDIAITNINLSSNSVFVGETLQINVTVVNRGTEVETFNVSAYYSLSLIGTSQVNSLAPASQTMVAFSWHTSSAGVGFYQISASAPLRWDANPMDNTFIYGIVQVKSRLPIHDVAITTVHPSSNIVYRGDSVEISVTAKNLGDFTESFNVTVYHNSNVAGVMLVDMLRPAVQRVLTLNWNTLNVVEGNYALSALAGTVAGEEDTANNHYFDGIVQVRSRAPLIPIHDVAVLNMVPSSQFVYVGEILNINVTLKNKGSGAESLDVVLYYDYDQKKDFWTFHVESLSAGAERTVSICWNTKDVPVGDYILSAYAEPVSGEELTTDNLFVDGSVEFATALSGLFVPDWLYWFLLIVLLILLLALLLLWFYRRRKESKSSFYSGWTAWYYCYDPRRKTKI